LLLAACGKSAQVPLQSWLGDAMEGPTPVSALIHAATMVTAGVYLIVRSGPIFNTAPAAQTAVVTVGAVTLLFGAVIGCAKDDIKKALAASTMSQIGYMVLAAGLGPAGYAVAILHLLTHGFFKAGLFLGAGSVMHAMNDETDIRRFGGLRTVLPITFVTFGIGYLAIIGVPPFAGFFSKDAIIESAFAAGGVRGLVLGTAALVGAGITAFYMTRVMLLTFFGRPRWDEDAHPHEHPVLPGWAMTIIILAVVFAGAWAGWRMYAVERVDRSAPHDVSALTRAARRDLYGDAVTEAVFMRPGRGLATGVAVADNRVVDGAARLTAAAVSLASGLLRRAETGYVRSYALSMLVGTVAVAGLIWMVGR
jgi:NADH-quinone oxidoreductase subunit L